ncbi:oligosaccharide flippase family protein [Candidatus Woesearchaeota archaeon]|nr:oligosaccharide flippase family protein [Candidatus Woesearchaeota archaeon]
MLKSLLKNSLYKNSIYLILNSILLSIFGFIFWNINARLYNVKDIGIATTLISVQTIIGILSSFGLGIAVIRYYSSEKEKALTNNLIILNTIISLVIGSIFILGISTFSPKLILSPIEKLIFILSCLIWTLFSTTNSIFIAKKQSLLILLKNLIFSILKLILPFLFIFLGSYGIFSSYVLATLISLIFTLILIKYKPSLKIDKNLLKQTLNFSFANYIASIFNALFGLLMPLIITNLLSPELTAIFYVPWMIANILFFIPTSVSQSFLAENTSSNNFNIKKSLIFSYILVIPAIILTLFLSDHLLLLFGLEYLQGSLFLKLSVLSTIIYTYNTIKLNSLNIQHKIKELIIANLITAFISISFSIVLINYGLTAIVLSWISGQFLTFLYLIKL